MKSYDSILPDLKESPDKINDNSTVTLANYKILIAFATGIFAILCYISIFSSQGVTIYSNAQNFKRISSNYDESSTMEFRIFLPELIQSDSKWMSESELRNYQDLLDQVVQVLGSKSEADEVRTDNYLVGLPYSGVKYRWGSNLEIKIRVQRYEVQYAYVEHWLKSNLGTGKFLTYKHDILKLLSSHSFGYDTSVNSDLIDNGKFVKIAKARKTIDITGSISEEVCYVERGTNEEIAASEEKLRRDGDDDEVPIYPLRSWISLGVQTTDDAEFFKIGQYLYSQRRLKVVWKAAAFASSIARLNVDTARSAHFIPVMGGYANYVRLVSESLRPLEADAMLDDIDSFTSTFQI